MSLPPDDDNLPDHLIRAYRRASAADDSRPSDAVRDAILARATQLVAIATVEAAAKRTASDGAQQQLDTATPAANDSRWKWKAAASIATLGLAGLLAVYTFNTSPRVPQPTSGPAAASPEQRVSESAPPTAAQPAAPMPADQRPGKVTRNAPHDELARQETKPNAAARDEAVRSAAEPGAVAPSAAAPSAAAGGEPARADAERSALAREAPSALVARTNATLAAQVQAQVRSLDMQARPPGGNARRQQVLAAVRAALPGFSHTAAGAGTMRLAVVMNSDGTIYRIARLQTAADNPPDAGAQITRMLGVPPDELKSPADTMTLPPTADQPDPIVVVYAIRRDGLGTSDGAH